MLEQFTRKYYIEINYTKDYSEMMQITTTIVDRKLSLKEAIDKSVSIFKNAKDTRLYKKENVKLYSEYNQLIAIISKNK